MDRLPRRQRLRPRSVVPAAAVLGVVVFGSSSGIPAVVLTHALQGSSSVARQSPLFSTAFQRQKRKQQLQTPQRSIWQGVVVEDDFPDEDSAAATKQSASPLNWPNHNDSSSTPISILSRQDLLRELGQTKKKKEEDHPTRQQQQQQDSTQKLQVGASSTTPNKSFLVRLGYLFALNAGMLNGLALSGVFLAKAASVSAVTGTYTHAAVAFSNHGMSRMLAILSTPLLYMMGSLVNGLCNPKGHEDFTTTTSTTRRPFYSLTMIQTAPLLLAGVLVGLASATTTTLGGSAFILPCLTMAMGLQNSWTSMLLPGNLLRTAHFSGITSDLGTVLGQTLRQQHQQRGKMTTPLKSPKISIFGRLLASFWMGGMMSAVGFPLWGIPPNVALLASATGYLLVWATMTGPIREKITLTTTNVVSKPTGKFLGRLFPTAADMVRRRRHDGAPKNVYQS